MCRCTTAIKNERKDQLAHWDSVDKTTSDLPPVVAATSFLLLLPPYHVSSFPPYLCEILCLKGEGMQIIGRDLLFSVTIRETYVTTPGVSKVLKHTLKIYLKHLMKKIAYFSLNNT